MKGVKMLLRLTIATCVITLVLASRGGAILNGARPEEPVGIVSRFKRQSGREPVSVSSMSASSSIVSTGGGGDSLSPPVNSQSASTRPLKSAAATVNKKPANIGTAPAAASTADTVDADYQDPEDQVRPQSPRKRPMMPPRRKAPRRQPQRYENHEDYDDGAEDEDCQDDRDYDMFSVAARPMRHISRMMGNMFNRMQDISSGGGRDFGGVQGASASAFSNSDSDGYSSRMSSVVRNNGRTSGIVSETRNGRTSTRRIGDDQVDSED